MISHQREELVERRYAFPVGKLMCMVREELKWADGKLIKEIVDQEVWIYWCEASHLLN